MSQARVCPAIARRGARGGRINLGTLFPPRPNASKGWVMARDLKVGDTLRTLDGPAQVESVEPGTVQPVFNLDVAEDADFFAGTSGALVHDNTLPETRLAPFDVARDLAA